MNQDTTRNRPSDEGKRTDPHVRDETATQPGVSTISSSDSDGANQEVTRSALDNQDSPKNDENADPAFDEIKDKS